MKKVIEGVAVFAVAGMVAFAISAVISWPFQLVWNYAVVAAISVAKPIGFWNAFWLSWFIGAFVRSPRSESK